MLVDCGWMGRRRDAYKNETTPYNKKERVI